MNAATVNSTRPMAHASCDGRRLRAYCIATATAYAPETKTVMSGSTDRRLAPADEERRRDDTQNYGTREWYTGRVGTAGRPHERRRDDRVAGAGRGERGEHIAAQDECGRASAHEDHRHGGERDGERDGVEARTTGGREKQHGESRGVTSPPQRHEDPVTHRRQRARDERCHGKCL